VTHTFRVLAVEDDDITFELVRTILRKLPLEFVHAPTGAQAIAFLNQEVPDLILLDINLPDMRGWDVLDKFRNDERLQRSRVIVLSANKDPVNRLIGNLQSVAVYLSKPVKANELKRQVQHLLDL
jgi:CheY-like chemotaxis protein